MTKYILRDSGENVYVFRSVEDLDGWVEAIDVAGGEYVGWDDSGQRLELIPTDSGHVLVRGSGRDETQVLTRTLRQYVEKVSEYHEQAVPNHARWAVQELVDWVEAANRD
ncbi:hypothetical protein [Kribbella sp. NPDC048915]|uniref:hypothetical protein n=1 Tax=Kribbella sp. NPDC048915 TaxID=3155148 RepID=UPI0033CF2609